MALYPTLMETLLAKKIEMAAQQGGAGPGGSRLFRTDSLDSTSSIGSLGSMALGEDVCRCDDCLLGIVDLYTISAVEQALSLCSNVFFFHRRIYWRQNTRSACKINFHYLSNGEGVTQNVSLLRVSVSF
uniref:Uncharacterized protein n=1 Tax=Lutzomyia longipalpis TaxID=7200 RepID=A0A7G3AYS2_LUTLO